MRGSAELGTIESRLRGDFGSSKLAGYEASETEKSTTHLERSRTNHAHALSACSSDDQGCVFPPRLTRDIANRIGAPRTVPATICWYSATAPARVVHGTRGTRHRCRPPYSCGGSSRPSRPRRRPSAALVRRACASACTRPDPHRVRRRTSSPDDPRVPPAMARGSRSGVDALSDREAPLHQDKQDLVAALARQEPAVSRVRPRRALRTRR